MKVWSKPTACALFLSLALTPVFATAQEMKGSSSKGSKSGSSQEMHANMMKGMKEMQAMKPTGNMDHDFAMMMRLHHKQAVEMAQMELQHGKDPQMRDMAQKIMDSQKKEIGQFDKWLGQHAGMKK